MRTYELVVIFDSSLEMEQIEADLKRFKEIMTSEGGFIRVWERWGKQRLAYEIRRRQYGYYTLVIFDTAPSVITELERIIRLTPSIIRHLIIVVDPVRAPEIDQESVETLGAARVVGVETVVMGTAIGIDEDAGIESDLGVTEDEQGLIEVDTSDEDTDKKTEDVA
jgi:small subunit ribosomal protein S6